LNAQQDYEKYYKLCNEALQNKVTGNIQKAITLYDEAFGKYLPFQDDLDELINCYKILGDTNNLLRIWRKKIQTGFTVENKSYLVTKNLENWNNFISQDDLFLFDMIDYDSLHNEYVAKTDNEKNRYLSEIITGDCFAGYMRTYYYNNPEIIFNYCKIENDSNLDINERMYHFAGSLGYATNGRLFINLAKSDHLPSRKESSLWEDEQFLVSLVHIAASLNKEEKDEFFEILKQHIKTGDISPMTYATLYDHSLDGYEEGNGRYGVSAMIYDEVEDGKLLREQQSVRRQIVTPKDIKNVDKFRAEIHLYPLWLQAKLLNQILPQNYKK
jgi:hypothetical protein